MPPVALLSTPISEMVFTISAALLYLAGNLTTLEPHSPLGNKVLGIKVKLSRKLECVSKRVQNRLSAIKRIFERAFHCSWCQFIRTYVRGLASTFLRGSKIWQFFRSSYCIPVHNNITMSDGQNRVHPESRWPKPGSPFQAINSPRAPSFVLANARPDPTLAEFETPPVSGYSSPHRLPDFNHTYPTMAGVFDQQPTRARVIASSRDAAGHFFCGRRGRACGRTLTLLCSLCVMRLSLTRVTKSHLLALGTTQISSYFTNKRTELSF